MKRLLLILAVILLCVGATFAQRKRVDGSGEVIRRERTVPAFDKIEASSAFKVVIKQGSPQSLVIEINDNVMEYVETTVSGGKLYIGFKSMGQINDVHTMAAHIIVPNLTEIKAHGACAVVLETSFNVNGNVKIDLGGAAKLSGKEFAVSGLLDVEMGGASQMELAMSANTVTIEASGASKLTSRLSASSVAIDASSAAKVDLSGKVATQTLSASGGASINLKKLDGDTAAVTASSGAKVKIGSANIRAIKTSGGASVTKE